MSRQYQPEWGVSVEWAVAVCKERGRQMAFVLEPGVPGTGAMD